MDPKGEHLWTTSRHKVPLDGSAEVVLGIPVQLKGKTTTDKEIRKIAVSPDGNRVIMADKDINYLVDVRKWVPTKRRNMVGDQLFSGGSVARRN